MAVAFDPAHDDPEKPQTWHHIAAKEFDPEKHKDMQFFCPCCLENGNRVRLKKPSHTHIQTIPFDVLDRQTEKSILDHLGNPVTDSRRYEIPARFTLYPKQTHTCDAAEKQSRLAQTIRKNGGTTLNSNDSIRIVNLDIPAGQIPVLNGHFSANKNETTFNTARRKSCTIQNSRPHWQKIRSTFKRYKIRQSPRRAAQQNPI